MLPRKAGHTPVLQRWGLESPRGRGLFINARAETAAVKPTFRESVRSRRCAIPCTGFYEWDTEKHKYCFTLPGQPLFYLAGLFEMSRDMPRFVVLTRAANETISDIHDRMPVIVSRGQCDLWLDDPIAALDILESSGPRLDRSTDEPVQTSLW